MRTLLVWMLCCFSPFVIADNYSQLYQAAGWPIQINHFHDSIIDTQRQYRNILPSFVYQSLVSNSNKAFGVVAMKQRGERALRKHLADPIPALHFFISPLGRRIVKAETEATSREAVRKNKNGVPFIKVTAERKALILRLIRAIPYEQGAAESANALANFVTNSLEGVMPGMGIGNTVSLLVVPTNKIKKQTHEQLESVLIYVYRGLSNQDLQAFVEFAESSFGNAYYRAALIVANASLNNK